MHEIDLEKQFSISQLHAYSNRNTLPSLQEKIGEIRRKEYTHETDRYSNVPEEAFAHATRDRFRERKLVESFTMARA